VATAKDRDFTHVSAHRPPGLLLRMYRPYHDVSWPGAI
jgi:hypothetical protein